LQIVVIQSNNTKKLEALERFLKAFKIDFSIEDKPYNAEFVAKI
jgi:non-canonical (house-cleaning) NTP pyrophosphatase